LTSTDGGLLLLKKANRLLGLTDRLSSCLGDPRKGDPEHGIHKMLEQRVYGICQGWEDCNDFDTLREDALYHHILGSCPASQPTLSRFENRVRRRDLYALSIAMVEVFIQRHRANAPKQIVIDMDATDDPTHGQQEFEFFHGYYARHCFLPMLVFCSPDGDEEELVGAILRPGNVHAGRRSAAILRRLVKMLRTGLPQTQILFRADAGFALPEVYQACEDLKISYLISLAKNSRVLEMAAPLRAQARADKAESGAKVRLFGEISYAADTWPVERRVIVKAEVMDKGENPRFVVTNLSGDPETLYDEYCRRGDCENRIKELKNDLASGRTSCHKFTANCFRLLLHAIAFILLSQVRRMLAGTVLALSTMGQIRLKLLKIAAQVQVSTRRTLIRLPRGHPNAALLEELLA
jgi:hypothetical protein